MKYFVFFGIAIVAIAVFAYFLIFSTPGSKSDLNDMTNNESVETTSTVNKTTAPLSGVSTLEALRLRGDNLECTISYTPDETKEKVEGTYFVSDGNIRGDFLTPAPDLNGQILSSIIINHPLMYIWSEIEGELYGIKVDLTTTEATATEKNQPVSLTANINYDCKPWENVDRTVFEPPSTVLFQDMGSLMKAGMEYGTIYETQPGLEM